MGYIGGHGVEALHKYKYSGVDHSYLAKYVLQPFWTRFVTFFPLWMPILVMFSGTDEFMYVCICACFRLRISTRPNMVYSPRLDTPPPRWVHLAHGLLLFLYQTFDAVDGKQARRTNSSSPLGELFDHGCDALACAFETMAFGSTAMCGGDTFWFWVISAVPFYGATWEHYFSHSLILPVFNGPTEGLALIYILHFMTAIVGAQWWAQPFRQSLPFLSWIPYITGKFLRLLYARLPQYVIATVCYACSSFSAISWCCPCFICVLILQSCAMYLPFSVYLSLELPTYKGAAYLLLLTAVLPTVACNICNVHKVVKARKGSMFLALAMGSSIALRCNDKLSAFSYTGYWTCIRGRMILAHLCDEPRGLKTNMCMSILYLPLAIANALTARLNDGIPFVDEFFVLLGYCLFTVPLSRSRSCLLIFLQHIDMHAVTFCLLNRITLLPLRHIGYSRNHNGFGNLLLQDNSERSLNIDDASPGYVLYSLVQVSSMPDRVLPFVSSERLLAAALPPDSVIRYIDD
ncbi:hypothetical protein V6N11_073514 [Hibiscus sabdariffa]|uniref:Uncharacterized protein n=1 Tax=Hibiscus sabdariffa TaxID=183260 RepID=A0ABR2NU78_9ROSI